MSSPKVGTLGDIDIETCSECDGTVKVIPKAFAALAGQALACIEGPMVIEKILAHPNELAGNGCKAGKYSSEGGRIQQEFVL